MVVSSLKISNLAVSPLNDTRVSQVSVPFFTLEVEKKLLKHLFTALSFEVKT